MEWYGIGAVALIGLAFYTVHRIPAFLVASAVIVGGFTFITFQSPAAPRFSEWCVMTAGLLAWAFGLSIVRLMLIRSVSLQLLGRIDGATADSFQVDIASRLNDMRAFRLVRGSDDGNVLTPSGQLIGAIAGGLYWVLRIAP
jgi:hypothetical protein